MFDYQALSALSAVIETQSFQNAAQKLCVTQSAVSQRIKSIESYYGESVLIRTLPYRPTEFGLTLLGHFKRVRMLEESLQADLSAQATPSRLSISISRDSLETWFVGVVDALSTLGSIPLEIIGDDQDLTLRYLQQGLVCACASTIPKAIMGCKSEFLGYFDYLLVSTPSFKNKYFKNKKTIKENLKHAPWIIFDSNDNLHTEYLNYFFDSEPSELSSHCHVVPSVAGFRQFALNGYAYALIPKIDILHELKKKKLVNIFPDKVWRMPLYWHTWAIETKTYKLFNELVLKTARKILAQT